MSIEMVRIPSETPNISNIDDFVGLRYAFGNQDGYILDKGNECSYTINGSIFKINSGRLVLQGIECDIDASGVEITVDNIATKRYYSIYLQVNLALNETKILATFDTATYPIIDSGDDLTKNTTGTAKLVLYNFETINGVISNVQKTIKQLQYLKNYKVDNAFNSDNANKINNLDLKRDSDGILKIDDIVIQQKKLLWSGSLTPTSGIANNLITINENIKSGDKLVIVGIANAIQFGVPVYTTSRKFEFTIVLNDIGYVAETMDKCMASCLNMICFDNYSTKKLFIAKIYAYNNKQLSLYGIDDVAASSSSLNQYITFTKVYKIIE